MLLRHWDLFAGMKVELLADVELDGCVKCRLLVAVREGRRN